MNWFKGNSFLNWWFQKLIASESLINIRTSALRPTKPDPETHLTKYQNTNRLTKQGIIVGKYQMKNPSSYSNESNVRVACFCHADLRIWHNLKDSSEPEGTQRTNPGLLEMLKSIGHTQLSTLKLVLYGRHYIIVPCKNGLQLERTKPESSHINAIPRSCIWTDLLGKTILSPYVAILFHASKTKQIRLTSHRIYP